MIVGAPAKEARFAAVPSCAVMGCAVHSARLRHPESTPSRRQHRLGHPVEQEQSLHTEASADRKPSYEEVSVARACSISCG
jgi:hypothetical protein